MYQTLDRIQKSSRLCKASRSANKIGKPFASTGKETFKEQKNDHFILGSVQQSVITIELMYAFAYTGNQTSR